MPSNLPIVLPPFFNSIETFDQILSEAIRCGASDLYFTPYEKVRFKIWGDMVVATNRFLDDNDMDNCIKFACSTDSSLTNVIGGASINTRYELVGLNDTRTRFGTKERRGFRVNVAPCYNPSGKWGAQIVLRVIPHQVPTYDTLGISQNILRAATPKDGIVYMAGKTGSGKSTTIAAIIRYILENDTPIKGNIITSEEPIEYLFHNIVSPHSIVAQSQIPEHFPSFEAANREMMRRAFSLAFIGEMRDKDSINAAITVSHSGHTAMGTIHASSVSATVPRILSFYPNDTKESAFFNIVESARLFMAQKLVKRADGQGMVAVREYLDVTEVVRERLFQIQDLANVNHTMRQVVSEYGHPFAADARRLHQEGLISEVVMNEFLHGGYDD